MIRPLLTVFVVYGDPEMGCWCDVCSLPSKIVWPVALISKNGVSNGATAEKCLNGCLRKERDA